MKKLPVFVTLLCGLGNSPCNAQLDGPELPSVPMWQLEGPRPRQPTKDGSAQNENKTLDHRCSSSKDRQKPEAQECPQ